MNEQDLITLLKSTNKAYVGIMPQSTFSNTIIRYEAGNLKPKTLRFFFSKFGYEFREGVWVK